MKNYKDDFYLREDVTFLNHGSFGATPKSVMETYQAYQIELEQQPVDFIVRQSEALFANVREKAATFLNTQPGNIVFIQNTTTGLNIVANTLELAKGDEVLATNLEYGAAERMWTVIAERKGFKYVKSEISLPITNAEKFTEEFFKNVSKATKIVFLSHITSVTALLFPVESVIKEAKKRGLITVIDGAHVPGHLPLNLDELAADFYICNFHKWVMSPKGTAVLYASDAGKKLISSFIIGWGELHNSAPANSLVDEHQLPGTRDMSATLSVPSSIEYFQKNVTDESRATFKEQILYAKSKFEEIFKTEAIATGEDGLQIYAHPLPKDLDGMKLKNNLWGKYKIEIPVMEQNGVQYIRISVHIYTDMKDIDTLINALCELV